MKKTKPDPSTAPQPPAEPTAPSVAGGTPLPGDAPRALTSPWTLLTTAEVLRVPLVDIQHVGAEPAIVLAAIAAGYRNSHAIATATGIRRDSVRSAWARLARAAYDLPDPEPAAPIAQLKLLPQTPQVNERNK